MRNPVLGIAIAFVLSAPYTAVAQNPSLNFQKIEHEYKPQKDDGSSRAATITHRKAGKEQQEYLSTGGGSAGTTKPTNLGRVQHGDIKINKYLDKSSPILMQQPAGSTGPTKPPIVPRDATIGLPTGKRQ